MPGRGEAFHRPLALPGGLVRVLGPVVQILGPAMLHRRHELAVRDPVAAQPVGDDDPRHVLQALEQLAEELLGGHRVSAWLDQDVEHIAVLIDRAPQVVDRAVDADEDLVEVPFVAGPGLAPAQPVGVELPKLRSPLPDRLVTDRNATRKHQLLDLTKAQREPVIQPHAVGDDLRRVPVSLVRRRRSGHDHRSWQRPGNSPT